MTKSLQLFGAIVLAFAACLSGVSARSAERHDVIVGTAGTSGTYYIAAAAIGKVITEHSDILDVIAQPTKGSIENINLTSNGDMEFGMSNSDGPYHAYQGTGMYTKIGKMNIKGCMALYMSAGHMVATKKSGIQNYGDLKGKKICLGPPGQTVVEMSKAILREYGIDPEKDITPYFLAIDEGMQKLTDGEIDASFFVAGVPTSGLINAASQADLVFVEAAEDKLDAISQKMPYYTKYTIPGGTYRGMGKDALTFKIMTELFTNADLDDAIVYDFVKQALDHREEYHDSHVVCREITPETSAKTIIPLHPGAEKYYREIGVIK